MKHTRPRRRFTKAADQACAAVALRNATSAAEDWRAIPGYEGMYEVSDQGRVRSFHGKYGRGVVLLSTNERGGYARVTLADLTSKRSYSVHRLVALAFLGPAPEGQPQVRHLDGDANNNKLSNLAYGSNSDNTLDMVAHGRHNAARKTQCKWGHDFTPENTRVRPDGARACRTCQRMRPALSAGAVASDHAQQQPPTATP